MRPGISNEMLARAGVHHVSAAEAEAPADNARVVEGCLEQDPGEQGDDDVDAHRYGESRHGGSEEGRNLRKKGDDRPRGPGHRGSRDPRTKKGCKSQESPDGSESPSPPDFPDQKKRGGLRVDHPPRHVQNRPQQLRVVGD